MRMQTAVADVQGEAVRSGHSFGEVDMVAGYVGLCDCHHPTDLVYFPFFKPKSLFVPITFLQ